MVRLVRFEYGVFSKIEVSENKTLGPNTVDIDGP